MVVFHEALGIVNFVVKRVGLLKDVNISAIHFQVYFELAVDS
jgi:hypothetical protein